LPPRLRDVDFLAAHAADVLAGAGGHAERRCLVEQLVGHRCDMRALETGVVEFVGRRQPGVVAAGDGAGAVRAAASDFVQPALAVAVGVSFLSISGTVGIC
jgi:hypothetical protein